MEALATLSPGTRAWFERAFPGPTPAQEKAWPAIATGGNVLVQAPTGRAKTLAAFLLGLDRLNETPGEGLRLLYVSPLKALNYDVERNLRGPLAGLASELSVGVRTGDTTSASASRCSARRPTSSSLPPSRSSSCSRRGPGDAPLGRDGDPRRGPRGRRHQARGSPRDLAGASREARRPPIQRIGLSATQRPLEEIGRFVAGTGREISLVDAGTRKELDLEVVVPSRTCASSERIANYPAGAAGRRRDGVRV